MSGTEKLKKHLKVGHVYRREDLCKWSTAIDRHLEELVENGQLEKLARGLYYVPKTSVFGKVPPAENFIIEGFLKDDRFLLVSPNLYNTLGLGTTQLYNKKIVYNHKRHGKFRLGNREFEFRRKYAFPSKLSPEFLLIDLANNLNELAEDKDELIKKIRSKASQMQPRTLRLMVKKYASMKTKKMLAPLLNSSDKDV